MKRLISKFLVSLLLAALLIPPACAEGPVSRFKDCTPDMLYSESINLATEGGYINGDGEGNFYPNRPITVGETTKLLTRIFISKEEQDNGQDSLKVCKDKYWISTLFLSGKEVITRDILYKAVLLASGVYVWDKELYVDSSEDYWTILLQTASEMGFGNESDKPLDEVTRGEAVSIMMTAKQSEQKCEMTRPLILWGLKIDELTKENECQLYKLSLLPKRFIDRLKADGWRISFNTDRIEETSAKRNMNIVGLTCYDENTIYIRNSWTTPTTTILHEVGHVIDNVYALSILKSSIFEEAPSTKSILGEYSQTNSGEYFAEFFRYYASHQDDEAALQKIQRAAPETYKMVEGAFKDTAA